MYREYINNDIGIFEIEANDLAVVKISYVDNHKQSNPNEITKKAVLELNEYFNKKRKVFTFPIEYKSTVFREKVWKELLNIPYGDTRSYSDIASVIGNPKAARAVGQAVHFNPLLIVVPCHRIIASGNKIGGFACGIDVKMKLLELEK